jgi:glutamate racemase
MAEEDCHRGVQEHPGRGRLSATDGEPARRSTGRHGSARPIGIFDSGIGGLSVLKALRAELPGQDFIYVADTGHAPYGGRDDAFICARSHSIADALVRRHGIGALVVACNTATAAAVHQLRAAYPHLPIVGVEPALKPAASLTRTGRVGVMATRFTVGSSKLRALHDGLKARAEFVLQPCDGLVEALEDNHGETIARLCRGYVQAMGSFGTGAGQIDTLVLGCTHYIFARDALESLVGPQVQIIETGAAVARQTRRMLQATGLLHAGTEPPQGSITLLTTGCRAKLQAAASRWLTTGVPTDAASLR